MTAAYRAPLALLLLLAACGDDKEKAIFVANTDTDRPTDRDTSSGSADTSVDSSIDPVDTTGEDTGSGADTDLTDSGSGDTATDTDLADTTPDTVADTTPDTVADTTPDTVADTTTDTVADTTPDTDADTAVDTRPEPPVVWTPTETPTPPAGVGIKTFTCPQRDPTSTFFITEIQINPNNAEGRGTSTEWFEVINMGATPFNLNGVRVADADTDQFTIGAPPPAGVFGGDAICATLTEVGAFFDVPTDTTIDPYEFFTFYQQTQIDAVCAADPSCKPYVGLHYYVFDRCFMAIANAGDEIILYDNRGRVLDCVEYGASADVESQSLQRLYRGGTWTDDWCVTAQDEALRYNSNAEVSATPVPGDYGTPGLPPRCVE